MPKTLQTVRTIEAMRQWVSRWRGQGMRSAVVPTMGALHDGHLQLVERGLRIADRVIVTIFVNPTQFAPGEDLDAYPRTEKQDIMKLRAAGAHVVFAPNRLEMYPEGFSAKVSMGGPAKAGLEDAYRPHFFDGVATVVAKLLNAAGCDYAMFGEKDFQQLKVVTAMARDLAIPTIIVGVPTVREADGLAMSSRNARLSLEERKVAPALHRAMEGAATAIRGGAPIAGALEAARRDVLGAGFREVEYLELRGAEGLEALQALDRPARLLAAAWLGEVRLIDNIAVAP